MPKNSATNRGYLEFAMETAYLAGRLTLGYFQTGLQPEFKNDDTPVTIADKKAEELIWSRSEPPTTSRPISSSPPKGTKRKKSSFGTDTFPFLLAVGFAFEAVFLALVCVREAPRFAAGLAAFLLGAAFFSVFGGILQFLNST